MSDAFDWWLTALGRNVLWCGLRELPAGTAQVLDTDGNLLPYDSTDTARAALMDAGYVQLDGLDDDDARAFGVELSELQPPSGTDPDLLHGQLLQKLPAVRPTN